MTKKDEIIAALPGLSKADLTAIKAVVGALLDKGVPKVPLATNNPQAWLFEALRATVTSPHHMTTTAQKAFNKNAPIALAFIAGAFDGVLANRAKAQALMRYLLGLLVEQMKRQKILVTQSSVAINLHRLERAFDDAFPDYTRAGVGMLVMRSLLRGETSGH